MGGEPSTIASTGGGTGADISLTTSAIARRPGSGSATAVRAAASAAVTEFAKMDASTPEKAVPSGTYRLVPATAAEFVKMDACLVEITLISTR
jgi:hypothetical protein